MALPYGVLTDRVGRKPFVLSSTIATALSEVRPGVVCSSYVLIHVATLFRLVSLTIIAELVASPMATYTLSIEPWILYMLDVVIMLAGAACSIFVPETLDEAKAREAETASDPDDEKKIEETSQTSLLKSSVFGMTTYNHSSLSLKRGGGGGVNPGS
ncbi:hypothetical protein TSTA_071380 [Talaromyces stipitatus ATCC 10500]|uniref:Uncharacterized protein n=1 Tax=Talaromyces stipitatus (strain ATCC 10500 / CBS 375.48 / QM 6759 / NRRL 1006) TaxID=441959 RepID=B8LUG8_TALSN|nr:uncharacterized protein TSTA_071380 [Talaromyces stipitatus ATCC 10500]EED23741.1 hypothetical protein TSTA_071380 [Talaromyces stipitatus ATCC 10500]